jgi:hypothetical protein
MGTSSSSSGPRSGVPFDPPWLEPYTQPLELAPPGRFRNARRLLGEYIKSGDRDSLKRGLGSYSRQGMGGAVRVAHRMRASTSAGAGLFNLLQQLRDSSDVKVRGWVRQLADKNLSANEIADEIVNQVCATGGSLDEVSCRNSMSQALSDLLSINSDIDLVSMDNDSIWMTMEFFIANEAFNRLSLDVGQLFESAKYSYKETVSRMNEMREYLRSEVSSQMQILRFETKSAPSREEINNVLQSALRMTFEVFEEEIA